MCQHPSVALNPNPIVQALGKPQAEFTREDLVRYVREQGIGMLTLRYDAGDGRLKALHFVINSEEHLQRVRYTTKRNPSRSGPRCGSRPWP